ncbi:MAG: LL-diaminopimelate aminotransferase [Candidatus Omnitrophota bacterium]
MEIEQSERLKMLPPYLFVEIDKAKREAKAAGRDIIDLGVGDPDMPTPPHIIEALKTAAQDGGNHHYAFDAGLPALRKEISAFCQNHFNVSLNPDGEIYPLIGSKEGIAHLPLAIINPKDKVLVPDPCYPVYRSATWFAGGKVVTLPLKAKNNFLPDLERIKDAKLLYINYPNNPTSATAPREYLTELVKICKEKGIIIASDLAYSEIYYDNEKPVSILEIEGAKDIAIEFHSLSKTFNMTGWRLGWACGNPKLIAALAKVKANVDSGIFQAIQVAGIAALKSDPHDLDDLRRMYQERRDLFINGLRSIGWKIAPPKAAFYVWAKLPKKFTGSMETAKAFLDQADIVATPGVGFGEHGEGFIRMTITVPKERLTLAVERLKKVI